MLGRLAELRSWADAAAFADHGCGAVTGPLLTQAAPLLRPAVHVIVGDVSGPRRTLTMMNEFDLLTPGERELRGAMGDFDQSLPSVAMSLMKKLRVGRLAVTMGRRGCVLFRPREDEPDDWFQSRLRSEFVPALNERAVDPVGAGDAFTAAATLGLAAGASVNVAGYLASAAAAIAVDHPGNVPVRADVLTAWLSRRSELHPPAVATAG